MLKGKNILLCVTGSVAAIETPKLVREMERKGANVKCVLSNRARKHVISKDVLEWASKQEVITEFTGKAEHVELSGLQGENKADLVLVAPCTANSIGKLANGIMDSVVSCIAGTAIGSKIPVVIVPCMYLSLYEQEFVKENIEKLKEKGMHFINPRIEENKAKFPAHELIINGIESVFSEKDLTGIKIVVTAGATSEKIDDVRFITNKSSGKTGLHLAEQAYLRGAEVILLRGSHAVNSKYPIQQAEFTDFESLEKAINENLSADVLIHTAAVSDFKTNKIEGKMDSREKASLELIPNRKLLNEVKEKNPNIFLVGFKAEHNVSKEELVEKALNSLREARADLVIANDISKEGIGFDSDYNELVLVDGFAVREFSKSHKIELANKILREIKFRLTHKMREEIDDLSTRVQHKF